MTSVGIYLVCFDSDLIENNVYMKIKKRQGNLPKLLYRVNIKMLKCRNDVVVFFWLTSTVLYLLLYTFFTDLFANKFRYVFINHTVIIIKQ